MLCLSHNKPVLCEKAFTVNTARAKLLYSMARSKNFFLMEVVWTLYFPFSIVLHTAITSGRIGKDLRVPEYW
jgi:predicted dehydrogenase